MRSSSRHAGFAGALFCLLVPAPRALAQQARVLYANDFEAPNVPPEANCATLDGRPIQTVYGKPAYTYQQINTVETVLLGSYGATTAENGLYALGMLSAFQDDRLALTFDAGSQAFLNVGFDLSALDVPGCGGPFGVARASMRVSLLDSPGGAFAWDQRELASAELLGPEAFEAGTPHFARVSAALSTAGSSDGHVSLVFDLRESGYATFDNLSIAAAEVAGVEDVDVDAVADDADNCPRASNPDQANTDGDLAGNVCDPAPTDPTLCGDIDGDGSEDCAPDAGSGALDAGLDDDAATASDGAAAGSASSGSAGEGEPDAGDGQSAGDDGNAGEDPDAGGTPVTGAPVNPDRDGGCGCSLAEPRPHLHAGWSLAGLGLLLALRRRRRAPVKGPRSAAPRAARRRG